MRTADWRLVERDKTREDRAFICAAILIKVYRIAGGGINGQSEYKIHIDRETEVIQACVFLSYRILKSKHGGSCSWSRE
jgi:hypothetical protein